MEESKKHPHKVGRGGAPAKSIKFTIIYGCQPAQGIGASSKFVADLIDLYRTNFDPYDG